MHTWNQLAVLAFAAGLGCAVGCGATADGDGASGGNMTGAAGNGGNTTDGTQTTSADAASSTSGIASRDGTTSTDGTSTTGGPITAPYSNADCTESDGPNNAGTESGVGAFAAEHDWHAGWANFSTDSSGADLCSGSLSEFEYPVYVADGQTLGIEPGAVFCGGPEGALVVSRGGTIDASGDRYPPDHLHIDGGRRRQAAARLGRRGCPGQGS